jgi:hypothetical protein
LQACTAVPQLKTKAEIAEAAAIASIISDSHDLHEERQFFMIENNEAIVAAPP